jgi:hypothetical protein
MGVESMRKLLFLGALGLMGWVVLSRYEGSSSAIIEPGSADEVTTGSEDKKKDDESFKCDGRTMCAEMTSCAEAKYFLKHCAATKMDGDSDGIPCEDQWCGHGG